MNEPNIFNLISKINDRNLQKKRESGLTTYALLAVLLFLIIRIVNLLPNFLMKLNPESLEVLLVAIVLEIGAIFIIYGYWRTVDYPKAIKFIKKGFESRSFLFYINTTSILFLPVFVSAILLLKYWSNINNKWYCISCIVIFGMFTIVFILGSLLNRNESKNNIVKLERTGGKKQETDFDSIMSYVTGFIFVIISTVYLIQLRLSLSSDQIARSFELGLYLTAIPNLIDYVFALNNNDMRIKALEDLEVEIYLNNWDQKKIIRTLQERHFGIGMSNWIKYKEESLSIFRNDLDKGVNDAKAFIKEMQGIDISTYKREVSARIEELEEKLEMLESKVRDRIELVNAETQYINQSYSSGLTHQEYSEYIKFVNSFETVINNFNKEIEILENDLERIEDQIEG